MSFSQKSPYELSCAGALAQGRPVHIANGAFQHDVADRMQLEMERAFERASPEALAARELLPVRRHREDKVGQSDLTNQA